MIRLQKLLAEAGLASRRTVEEWIRSGRVTVGGRTAQLGDRAAPGDDVRLDGSRLDLGAGAAAAELLLYNKPVGEVTTRRDPQRRPTVFDRLPPPARGRWISVGRLDVNTSGLLLLTSDGELAHRLMHPSGGIEREYLVRVRGRPGPEVLRQLREGVPLEDGPAHFDSVSTASAAPRGSHSAFRVILREGRKREVRRLWQAAGFEVSRLLRIRYGPIGLPRDLPPGRARAAGAQELEALRGALAGTGAGRTSGAGGPAAGRAAARPGGVDPASK
jgi:23S rRNA pseudouridine2605 synthase